MSYASVDGHECETVTVYVPQRGVWYAECAMIEAPELSGRVTIALGDMQLSGTVDPAQTGTRGGQLFVRIVAGAGAWGTLLAPKAYHSDAGVQAATVAQDAAREAGETISGAPTGSIGVRYVRRAGPASQALSDATAGAWWVDYDGVTQVGARPALTPAADSYVVLDEQPGDRVLRLAMDDLRSVGIGSVLTEGVDESRTIREMEIRVTGDDAVIIAWCGGSDESADRVGDLLAAFVASEASRTLVSLYRYRVSQMDGERVKLQAISRAAGLPDLLPVDMLPGVAGAHAELALGSEVLVSFVEGDPRQPVITQYAGRRGPGHVPTKLTIDATQILWGAAASAFVALSTKTDTEIQRIWTLLTTWVPTLSPAIDNGAALKTAAGLAYPGVQSTASTKVKSE